jgi:hypothetical protein|tara:strand:+ start:277 stop:582 length:306 start_codon:yes stop_codon:yes gene_type:complete
MVIHGSEFPMDYWSTTEATTLLQRHLGVATDREMLERLQALARRLRERHQSLLPRRSAAHAKELVMVEIVTFTFITEAALLSVLTSIVIGAVIRYEWINRE